MMGKIQVIKGRLSWVDKDLVSTELIARLREKFTLYPEKGDYGEESVIYAFEENKQYFGFPREAVEEVLSGIPYEIIDKTTVKPKVPMSVLKAPWPNQVAPVKTAIRKLKKTGGTIIQAPCGTGKTNMALYIAAELGQPTLVLVHKGFLMEQWVERIKEVLGEDAGIIQQNKCDFEGRLFTVGMMQSIASRKYQKEIYEYFGLLIADEVHRCGCTSYNYAVRQFSAKYKLGMSVAGDSMLLLKTQSGIEWVSIQDLAKRKSVGVDKILPVSGIKVRAHNGKNYEWSKVTHIHKYQNTKQCLKLETDYGKTLIITEDHGILRAVPTKSFEKIPGGKKYHAKLLETKGSDLKVGDYLVLDLDSSPDNAKSPSINLVDYVSKNHYIAGEFSEEIATYLISKNGYKNSHKLRYARKRGVHGVYLSLPEMKRWCAHKKGILYTEGGNGINFTSELPVKDFAWILGFFLGDGWATNNSVTFAVGNSFIEEFKKKIAPFLAQGNLCPIEREMLGNSIEYKINCASISQLFNTLNRGKKCFDKELPAIVWSWSREDKRLLVEGLIDSDGHRAKKERNRYRIVYSTTSKKLAQGLQTLVESLGTQAGIYVRKPSQGGTVQGRIIQGKRLSYMVSWSGHSWYNTGVSGSTMGSPFIIPKGFGKLVKLKTITPCAEDIVYDLSVEKHENFSANGLLAHNSATIRRKDNMDCLFYWHIGPIGSVLKKEIKNGKAYQFKLKKSVNMESYSYGSRINFTKMITDLTKIDVRQNFIANEIIKLVDSGRKILVLSDRKAHLKDIEDRLKDRGFSDCGYYVGGTAQKKLNEAATKSVLLGTFAMAQEALDIPSLDTVVLTTPKSDIEQAVGRILRDAEGKKSPLIIDIIDPTPILVSMARKRARQYSESPSMNFEVTQIQL